jgi:hypothetical protein
MARQIGIIPIKGTIDGLTFYETPDDGHLVKQKTRVTGERVKNDPDYRRTMLNAAEFKISIRSAQLLRHGLNNLLFPIADGKLSSRMNKELVQVVQMDDENDYGERMACSSNLTALEGFDFNRHLRLQDVFAVNYSLYHDEVNKEMHIDIPEFTPSAQVHAPEYVEYFQLISGAAIMDFETSHVVREFWATEQIRLNKEPVDIVQFRYPANIPPGYTLFVALGVLFYAQLDNIPKNATSQRKRQKLKSQKWKDGFVPFTGALSLVKVIAGEAKDTGYGKGDGKEGDEWTMDGLGIA